MELSHITLMIEIYDNDAAIPKYKNASGETIFGFVTLKVSDIEEILYIAGQEENKKLLKKKTGRRTVEIEVATDHYLMKALGFKGGSRP